jgi:hypothetical protein
LDQVMEWLDHELNHHHLARHARGLQPGNL